MKVIGAGLPRTGTLTQKVALEMLGCGPCYHMVNLFADLGLVAAWREVFEGRRDWDTILAGHESAVDWPASFYYRDLIEHYPKAKVLLSVRDPEDWERSMRATVCVHWEGDTVLHHLTSASAQVDPTWGAYIDLMHEMWKSRGAFRPDGRFLDRVADMLERHTAAVTQAVPEERLLKWDVNEGWEPLCAFLGVDVPQAPLPKLNDSRTYVARATGMSLRWLTEWWEREAPASGVQPAIGARASG